MNDLISRQDATTIPVMPKEHREYQTMNLDDAYEQGWFDCQKCIEELPSAQPENARERTDAFALPEIIVLNEYDTIESEDGRTGFGVYVPEEKKIYVAGDVPQEMKLKALFHELAHWVQDVSGIDFDEYTANELSEIIYDAVAPEETHDKRTETHTCDCISRQAAIRIAEQGQIQGFEWQFKKLCELPSAEPERKKGRWRRRLVDSGFNADWHCSECGWKTSLEEHGYNFCPNCGADMRGGQG